MKKIEDIPRTPETTLTKDFVDTCKSVKAKRPRTVIEHILRHGVITTDELKNIYDYKHPPRAVQDVKDNGIPLTSHRIRIENPNRTISAYTFDTKSKIVNGRLKGRIAFSKQFKKDLVDHYLSKDAFTCETVDPIYLQIDHRVPYQISGEDAERKIENFMLLDASSQRKKSWACEHCANYTKLRDKQICSNCFWAYPEEYDHIAQEQVRRIEIVWAKDDVNSFDRIASLCKKKGVSIQNYIKEKLK